MGITIKLEGLNPERLSSQIVNDRAKLAIAASAAKIMNDYVPMGDGVMLRNNVEPIIEKDNPTVHYKVPYAHFAYVGDVMVGKSGSPWAKKGEIKSYSSPKRKLKFEVGTAKWDEVAFKAKKEQFVRECTKILERG